MKTATVIIKPIKGTTVSFAVPVIPAPLRECTGRKHATAERWQPCNNRKGLVMKLSSKCRCFCLASPHALCVSLLVAWSGIAAHADTGFPTRGSGAELLVKPMRSAPVSDVNANKTAPMSCPKCKSEWSSHPDYTARGAIKPTVWVEKHLCEGCETTITTAGVGRSKHSVAVHKCTTCGAPNEGCCSTAGTTPAAKSIN
jgi:hypothetical protein